ncbi:MAG: sialate O-acetylesterase [Bacteroidota bacterium]
MKHSFILLIFLSSNLLFSKDYYTYFLGGQSNMDGYGYNKDLPETLAGEMEDVMIFHGNTEKDNVAETDGRGIWSSLRPGHGVQFSSDGLVNTYSNRFGLELTFAQAMKEFHPDHPVALIKYSRGGTSIDSAAARHFGCWEPDFVGTSGINQYDHFLATLRYAMAVRDIDGDGEEDRLIPMGILWMQGESDGAATEEIAFRYMDHLKRLMDLMRAALHVDKLPVIIGKISDSGNDKDGKVWDHGELVQYAEEKYVRTDARAAIVRSTEKYKYSDPWHYDSAGYLDLGEEFAKALINLLKN